MSPTDHQQQLRLLAPPRPMTVELLFRMFGNVVIPVEEVRTRLFRNLNAEQFRRALATERLPVPATTLDDSRKAPLYIEIHHLAAFVEHRAAVADSELSKLLSNTEQPETA